MSRSRRAKQRIASCALEAIVGALYRDQGFNAARAFVQEILLTHAEAILESKALTDPKSLFQEEAQKRVGITPSYTIVDERGPNHAKKFRVAAMLADQKVAEGEGASKKDAQQKAAQQALKEKRWTT